MVFDQARRLRVPEDRNRRNVKLEELIEKRD